MAWNEVGSKGETSFSLLGMNLSLFIHRERDSMGY